MTSNDDDNDLWHEMTEDVTPLSNAPRHRPTTIHTQKPLPNVSRDSIKPPALADKMQAKDLDRRTDQKLSRGKMAIEGRLDLHGLSQEQAHLALTPFILSSQALQKRCVLIITGKGKGILRDQLPIWLNQSPLTNLVLKVTHAQPKDGGSGAFYVYLRRNRT
jgi:DNA-nicking Smr family endonuclease